MENNPNVFSIEEHISVCIYRDNVTLKHNTLLATTNTVFRYYPITKTLLELK